MKRTLVITLLAAVALAGAAFAALVAPSSASAWNWQSLPSGYSVSSYQTCYDDQGINHMPSCGSIPVCDHLTVQSSAGSFTEADCVASFQSDLDRYVDSTICTVNPGAGGQACQPTTTASPTTTGATTTTATTTTAQTTTDAAPSPQPAATPITTTVQSTLPSAPYADFSAAKVNPDVIEFTDSSSASSAITTRAWQFGDGTAGTGASPVHPYSGTGSYYVTLTVIDSNGLTSVAVHVLTITADHTVTLGPRQTQIAAKPKSSAKHITKKKTNSKKKAVAKKRP